MKRFLILSGTLFVLLNFWSSTASAWTNTDSEPYYNNGNSPTYEQAVQKLRNEYQTKHPCTTRACRVTPKTSSAPSSNYFLVYLQSDVYGGPPTNCTSESIGSWCDENAPPSCDSPNYIDVVSGECVAPEEFCYTNLESQADECILIGDEDGDGLNCVTDSSGLELCLGDNPLCHTANGQTFCPEPDAVCGEKNGVYSCVNPAEEGCGYFNGEKVCFTPDGTQVDESSPDHPDNGGNLDGNDTNDPTDARDPTDGGDPNNQPGESDTSSTDAASEKTARDSLNELREIDKGIDGVKSAVDQGFASLKEEGNSAEIDGVAQDIANTPIAGLQELEDGIGLNPLDGDSADGVGTAVTGLVQQGSCVELGFNFNGHTFGLPCDKTQKIRDMLSWVLYFLTVWMLFEIVTSPVVRRA